MLLSAGAALTVVAVEASAAGTVWVLERASDGARASVHLAATARGAVSVGGRHRGRRHGASAPAGCCRPPAQAIAFIPNEIGAALLYNERVTR